MKKINLLIITLLTALLFMLSACSDDGDSSSDNSSNGGNGDPVIPDTGYKVTSDGSWEVHNAKGLLAFYDNVTNDNNSLNVILTDNITLELNSDNSSNWVQIDEYHGIFEGDNHTITNVAMHEPLLNDVAFFKNVYGTVKNVKFDNISVTGNGLVAGVAYALHPGGTLENVSTDNKSKMHSISNACGIVYENYGTIINSSNSASLTGDLAGGITCFNFDIIIASFNAGTISGTGQKGGIVAHNRGDIIASYNTGSVTGSHLTGGISGDSYDDGRIISVYNIGEITGSDIGGIVERNSGVVSGAYSLSNSTINNGIDPINIDIDTRDNVSNVDNISSINSYLDILNNGIDDFEDFVKVGYGYRFVDGGSNAPQLETVPIVLRGISVSANVTSIEPGGNTTQLIVETNPSNVEYPSLKFTSSDESVATVSDNGTVTSGNIEDNVTITVSTADNASRATIEITVAQKPGHEIDGNTWKIFKANGLVAFREAVNSGEDSLNAILTDNITLELNSDNSSNWVQINDYHGIFDGDNHTITNIAMLDPLLDDVAFFKYVYGTVKNVKFDNISVTGEIQIASVAYSIQHGGTLTNVSTDNKSKIYGTGSAGGLVTYNNGTIVNSSNSATVTGTVVGGIAYWNTGTVIASDNTGTIISEAINVNNVVGGIVGHNVSDVIACYNTGVVVGVSTNGSIGGIAGNNDGGTITSVYNIGEITGHVIGGIVGLNGNVDEPRAATVSGAYSLSNNGINPIHTNSGEYSIDNVSNISAISELNDETEDTGKLWILNNYLNNEDWEFYDHDSNADTAPIIRRKP